MTRYKMIKRCLHLPFSQNLAAQKSLAFNFWSLAFVSTVSLDLLVLNIKGPLFFSQQPIRTNRQQTQLRTIENSQETFEESTLNGMACC